MSQNRLSVEDGPTPREAVVALPVLWLLLVFAFGVALYTPAMGPGFRAADFNMFHAVGRIAWQDGLAEAYRIGALDPADILGPGGGDHEMLFTYPPQFGFLLWPLGPLDRAIAYGVFVGLSLALFLYVVFRLAGRASAAVLTAGLPILTGAILSGQTALLAGALVGLFALSAQKARARAGVPLGLMAIKAHLAPGLALLVLAEARWRLLVVAAVTVAASLALATIAFGHEVWPPFFEAGSAAAERLSALEFKLNRMTSAYALAATAGAPHGLALVLHAAAALAAAAVIAAAARSRLSPQAKLGLAALLTLGFSPYVYDYDMAILVVALASLWPELVARVGLWARLLVGLLAWATSFYVYAGLFTGDSPIPNAMATDDPLAIPALAYLSLAVLVGVIFLRAPHTR